MKINRTTFPVLLLLKFMHYMIFSQLAILLYLDDPKSPDSKKYFEQTASALIELDKTISNHMSIKKS